MNKEEIKKALKYCTGSEGFEGCMKCPYFSINRCSYTLSEDALTLIEEQEKEIEKLETFNNKLSQGIYYGNGEHLCNNLQKIKKEAINEFAEEVRKMLYYEFDEIIPSIISDKIDKLLEEYKRGKND